MKPFWTWVVFALCLGGFFALLACQFTPEQRENATQGFRRMLEEGLITQEQFDAILASMTSGDWTEVRNIAISTGLGILGAMTGIHIHRGPSHKGAPMVTTAK